MEYRDIDGYEKQKLLLDKFLNDGDQVAFKKMFNEPFKSTIKSTKKSFGNSLKLSPDIILNTLKHRHKRTHNYKKTNTNANIHHRNFDLEEPNFNGINDFKIDMRNLILQDPELKSKSMKGNYKWGTMKFNMMKSNWAKRRGISIDNFQMPKVESVRKKTVMEIGGQNVIRTTNTLNYC